MTGMERVIRQALKALEPPEALSPVEWSEKNLILSRGRSAKPGRFKAWPWQIEPIECCRDKDIASVVLCWPAQVCGKTSVLLATIGYSIAQSPCPMLFVFPSV